MADQPIPVINNEPLVEEQSFPPTAEQEQSSGSEFIQGIYFLSASAQIRRCVLLFL